MDRPDYATFLSMDVLTTVTSILGLLLTLVGISVAAFALEEKRRKEFFSFWKRWLTIGFVVLLLVNSTLGLYLFFTGPAQIVRVDVIRLMLHMFNLLAIPGIWFMTVMRRLMDVREAKRKELESVVEALKARLDALTLAPAA